MGVPIASFIGLTVLILDGKTAIEGAQNGLEVCFHTVIPSLFPFIFLSSLLTGSLTGGTLIHSNPLRRLFRIPNGSEAILLTGLLGGYPIGAKCVNEALINGQLSPNDAERMTVFCNAAGPAFLFGMAANLFEQRWIPWCLWCIHLFSALCIARLLPGDVHYFHPNGKSFTFNVTRRFRQSIQSMAEICGWIILSRIVISILLKWCLWCLPHGLQIGIIGIMELSNGCIFLYQIENSGLRLILCSMFLGFGGMCVALQTFSTANSISCRKYLTGKMMQGMISFVLSYMIQRFTLPRDQRISMGWLSLGGIVAVLVILWFFAVKRKKSSGILETVGV